MKKKKVIDRIKKVLSESPKLDGYIFIASNGDCLDVSMDGKFHALLGLAESVKQTIIKRNKEYIE